MMISIDNFTEIVLSKFRFYETELLKWNNNTDLVSKKNEKFILKRHIFNALQILPFFKKNDKYIYDVGTGAGFPGLVCAIYDSTRSYILYEKKYQKRIFLKHIIMNLNLKNVEIKDSFYEKSINQCDVLTSRGLLDLSYCKKINSNIKKFILFKGHLYNNEIIVLNTKEEQDRVKCISGYDSDSFFLMS